MPVPFDSARFYAKLDRRRAHEQATWMALGAALATRGEPRSFIGRLCAGRPSKVRKALERGYDSAKGNAPQWPPPVKRKVYPTVKPEKAPAWMAKAVAAQRRKTHTLIDRLYSRIAPGERGIDRMWHLGAMPERVREAWYGNTISGAEFRRRVAALGLTNGWFSMRCGHRLNWAKEQNRLAKVPKYVELALDRQELLWELATLIDCSKIISKEALSDIVRKRFADLP